MPKFHSSFLFPSSFSSLCPFYLPPLSPPPPPSPSSLPPSLPLFTQAYAVLLFWYQIFNGFSGSTPIDGINLLVFNLLFTSLPILVVAITDQDLRASTLLQYKHYYEQGRCSKVYTRWKFWLAMLEAFYQSAVVFFIAYGVRFIACV